MNADRTSHSHVVLISVDGMHVVDLANYIEAHPLSHLVQLATHGVIYPKALNGHKTLIEMS